jgi:hypothetical protein
LVLAVLSIAAALFVEPVKLPLSIIVGGLLALVNFSGLRRGIQKHLNAYRPTMKLFFLSIFRLFIVFAIIIALAVGRAVNLLGLAAGFTVVLAMLTLEGLKAAQKEQGAEENL